jgi:hypothetical protein
MSRSIIGDGDFEQQFLHFVELQPGLREEEDCRD